MIPAEGVRIGWSDLPPPVTRAVEDLLGSRVVASATQPGGFSPGTADRVRTANGGRAFVKAVGNSLNEVSVDLARREAHITAHMPAAAPVPQLYGVVDDGEWVALVYEDVEGRHPRTPWVPAEIDATVAALDALARATTPSPVPDAGRVTDQIFYDFHGWDRLAAEVPADLDPWAAAHLDELQAAAARGLAALADGDTLTHCDIRADNLLVRTDGSVAIVDWPWGSAGPPWLDRLLLAMNVAAHGGNSDRLLAGIDPDRALDVVAGITGHWQLRGRQPPPPGLPTVRAFQRELGRRFLSWVSARWDLRHITTAGVGPRTSLDSR
jgi:hypothetical protein